MTDLLQGTPYRALSPLAWGSLGPLVLAEPILGGAPVAVRVLHRMLAGRADFAVRMRVEAEVLARLTHPGLVRVIEHGQTRDGRGYVAMEHVPGRTLAAELDARGALPVAEALGYAQQALAALDSAHAAGLVHRDLKLSNLILCESPRGPRLVKVVDFGITKALGRTVSSRAAGLLELDFPIADGTLSGRPRCLSPEQVRGARADARTDVYGVGAVLYALLAGRGPFDDARGPVEIAEAHAIQAPSAPSKWARERISPELDAAVLRALAKSPADRFPSAAAFSAELARIAVRLGRPTVWRDALADLA